MPSVTSVGRVDSRAAPLGTRGWRVKAIEIREPDLDERPHGLLEPGVDRHPECLLVRLAHLFRRHALLEPVVAGHEELLDPFTGLLRGHVG